MTSKMTGKNYESFNQTGGGANNIVNKETSL